MRIGWIGLGAMGAPMLEHLLGGEHAIAVHARREATAAHALSRGARIAPSPRALAAEADVVLTCLPGPPEIEAVVRGPGGLLEGARPGSILIDLSTNAPALARDLHAACAASGVGMLDAPVSGGPTGAAARKLAIWASGDEAAFARARPLLERMGDQVRFLGASGTASVAKLVHNCANYSIGLVMAEVFTLGVKAGVDPAALFAAIRQGTLGRRSVVDRLADQFLPGDYDRPSFALALAHKDVSLATALARETRTPMKFAELTLAEMTEALNRGWGARDSRVTMRLQEERAGVDVRVAPEVLADILKG